MYNILQRFLGGNNGKHILAVIMGRLAIYN